MFESKYLCTFALFDTIPTLDGSETVTQEILRWNKTMKTSSKSRLVRNGTRETAPRFGLSERHDRDAELADQILNLVVHAPTQPPGEHQTGFR